jgi:hypothetical protein
MIVVSRMVQPPGGGGDAHGPSEAQTQPEPAHRQLTSQPSKYVHTRPWSLHVPFAGGSLSGQGPASNVPVSGGPASKQPTS